jgi:uncharacterized protein GlcG (DUF336 family)
MRDPFLRSGITLLIAAGALGAVLAASGSGMSAETAPMRTPWGDPDLQGIWTDETDTPLQRSLKFGNQEFFTEAERAELDRQRASMEGRDRRAERGTTADVAGAYNDVFTPKKRTGARTSRIVVPAHGRLPPQTPEAQKLTAAERAFRLSLLQATSTCKNNEPPCRGGTYDPRPSPRFAELPPRYNTATINRYYGPEDASLAVRCLMGGLPENGTLGAIADRISFRRIVQTPGGIAMFYDVGQGQGWQRNIVMDGSPHLPAAIRQWYGDSRGHWEGDTLVIDVTNFSPKTDFQGARENLHVVERWRRSGPTTTASPSKTRPSGRKAGPRNRNSPCRTIAKTASIPSPAVSRAITVSRACCRGTGYRKRNLPRAKAPIREPSALSRMTARPIRWNKPPLFSSPGRPSMRTVLVLAASLACALTVEALAQPSFIDRKQVSPATARKLVDACVARAEAQKQIVGCAVVDISGVLVDFHAMGGQATFAETAILKAKTAAHWQRATSALEDDVNSRRNGASVWIGDFPRAGGVPIMVDGQVAGAMGVGGGSSEELATFAIEAVLGKAALAQR